MEIASICLMILTAASGNLLVNPGFEAVRGDVPIRWDLFVMPQDGCYGEVDEKVCNEGEYAAKLHNGSPYEKEPANNWSQSITTNLRNKELLVKGWIKTEAATEAALWLQCFQRNPLRIVAFSSTGTTTPVYGDTDWRQVEMEVSVPSETDFVMLRCVLLGEGTAWFDGVSVEDVIQTATKKSGESEKGSEDRERKGSLEDKGDDSLEELRASREALAEANRSLRELNTSLLAQISTLQAEVQRLREQVQTLRLLEPDLLAPTVPPPRLPSPPLVPHVERREEETP
jgi:hypothetical protein